MTTWRATCSGCGASAGGIKCLWIFRLLNFFDREFKHHGKLIYTKEAASPESEGGR